MSVRELNESEPFDDMSKRRLVVKSIDFQQLIRKTVAASCLPATEQPALRRQSLPRFAAGLYTGFYMEPRNTAGQAVRNYHYDVPGASRLQSGFKVFQRKPKRTEVAD